MLALVRRVFSLGEDRSSSRSVIWGGIAIHILTWRGLSSSTPECWAIRTTWRSADSPGFGDTWSSLAQYWMEMNKGWVEVLLREKREKLAKESRAKQKYTHKSGSKSFARKEKEIAIPTLQEAATYRNPAHARSTHGGFIRFDCQAAPQRHYPAMLLQPRILPHLFFFSFALPSPSSSSSPTKPHLFSLLTTKSYIALSSSSLDTLDSTPAPLEDDPLPIRIPFDKLFVPPEVDLPLGGAAAPASAAAAASGRVLKGSNIVLGPYAKDAQVVTAEFVNSSVRTEDCPADGLPEFALVGRSKLGKSSLLNSLVRRKRLTLTSKKPATTRSQPAKEEGKITSSPLESQLHEVIKRSSIETKTS
ncbi:GTP-binding protein [Ananas comosus]|uniref:GTP-binding protein n=1 Tax=Ananas comosus TaxID=4615 RepID=A0A199VLK0_ANACO|nr:GTP-binding protein [Ananas comosus]